MPAPRTTSRPARPNTATRPLGYLLAPLVLGAAVLAAQLVSLLVAAVTR